ncbi:restriction endonuclease subunit S [Plesiomonas shigelloides]|uniref:restriction endonuclease subunit S n=1 Tax=Plesiomonas shigelloides TaxID=703 RepID=UPI000DDA3E85|nr:restriction endonuclease subunit S [Plesiomonas shigelloides]
MSFDWLALTLGDVCKKITDGAHKSPKSVDDGKLMASVKDLTRFGVDLSNARRISKDDFDELVQQGCKPQVGDVLIAKDGNSALDTVCTVDSEIDAVLLSSVAILRPDPEKLDSNFLKYYFCSPQVIDYLKTNFISGAAIPRVVLRDFRKAKINLPPLRIQRKISQCLSSIDNKILSNNQTNQTLEQMAQAIFKSWFVDFDPVKAKMNGEQPEGMDAATASLFPDKLVESELGLIPEGWMLSEIGEEVTVVGGSTPSTKNDDFWINGDIHWTSPKDLSGVQDKVLLDTAGKITEAGLKKISSGLLPVDTVLLSSRAPVGYLALAKVPMAINQGYIAMKCEKQLPPEFVLQWCVYRMDEIKQRASGSTFAEISKKSFKPISVVVPTGAILSAYQKLVKPIYNAITSNARQNEQLSTLRDTLLPKLLSGEIELAPQGEQ